MPIEQIDTILKEITNLNNKINPYYLPRTEPLEVDRKDIIVIWCPSGIQKGQRIVSGYYRNRRLGEFLKELSLTEGRNTGIPTLQRELAHNGSPAASFETDEECLSFLVRIPCHEGEEGVSPALFNDKEITKETKEITKENPEEQLEIARSRNISKIQVNLLKAIIANPSVILHVFSSKLGLTIDQIRYQRKQLESKGIILCRKGATKKQYHYRRQKTVSGLTVKVFLAEWPSW